MSWSYNRDVYKLLIFIGLIQVAVYLFLGLISCSTGGIALPQPDSPLYYQAARRIVEGHPFSFTEGSNVCTGTTTVLYPFLLAVPYALGFSGDAIIVAGFILNSIFYFVFLLSWAKAIDIWCDRIDVKMLSALLIALSGHCAFGVFAQTDMGFWLAFSGLFALALSRQSNWQTCFLLVLAAWVRPEGIILLLAFATMTMLSRILQKDAKTRHRVLIVVAGVFSACAVFVLNYALTGHPQFSSVVGKGHFATLPFASAVISSVSDLFSIIKGMFLGLATGMPRDLLSLPVFGAILLFLGVVSYRWSRDSMNGLMVFVLAAGLEILNIAQSGMQGRGMDRYLVWTIPLFIMFMAHGICLVEDRLPSSIRKFPTVLVVFFFMIGSFASQCYFFQACSYVDSGRLFAKDCETIMPKGTSVGGLPCAPAYYFSSRRLANLSGIYSPEFAPQDVLENIERLRNNEDLRFDYWLSCSDLVAIIGARGVSNLGDVLLPGPAGMTLIKADWGPFDSTTPMVINGKSVVAKVDVGYAADESAAAYRIITRWGYPVFEPFVQFGALGGKEIIDVGRVILGGDEMTVPLKPGADTTVIARLWPKHSVVRSLSVASDKIDCAFSNPLRFNISVDGDIVGLAELSYSTNSFSDVAFQIPGSAIKNPLSRIGFLGDHIAFGYWFYQ